MVTATRPGGGRAGAGAAADAADGVGKSGGEAVAAPRHTAGEGGAGRGGTPTTFYYNTNIEGINMFQ